MVRTVESSNVHFNFWPTGLFCVIRVKLKRLISTPKRSLGQGNVFTHVCHSVHGEGGVWLPSMHHRSHDQYWGDEVGFPACITGHMTRGSAYRGLLSTEGFPSRGSVSRGCASRGRGVCIQAVG